MTATLLLILGSLAAVTVLYAGVTSILNRSQGKLSFVAPVTGAPPHPDRPAFMLAQAGERRAPDQANTWSVSGLTKQEAEDCLDWLEANGYGYREVDLREDGFAIRFQ